MKSFWQLSFILYPFSSGQQQVRKNFLVRNEFLIALESVSGIEGLMDAWNWMRVQKSDIEYEIDGHVEGKEMKGHGWIRGTIIK